MYYKRVTEMVYNIAEIKYTSFYQVVMQSFTKKTNWTRENRHHWHTRRADVLSALLVCLPVVAISPHKHELIEPVVFERGSFWPQNVSALAKQPLNPSGRRHRGVVLNEQVY